MGVPVSYWPCGRQLRTKVANRGDENDEPGWRAGFANQADSTRLDLRGPDSLPAGRGLAEGLRFLADP